MSLTNPKTVVTEERLSEFYQQILPYLGGMPEMLANKFSKSDIYSTDEKMIGQWIDGKPLYQKTVDCGVLPNNTSKNVAHGISNLDTVIKMSGIAFGSSAGYQAPLPFVAVNGTNNQCSCYVQNENIVIIGNFNWSGYTESYITLQYTKTTDSPVAIGNDTDYSTEEKIVGTWIDGKPLYQKTFTSTLPTVVTDGTEIGKFLAVGELIDTVVSVQGLCKSSNGAFIPAYQCLGISNSKPMAIRVTCNNNKRIETAERNSIWIGSSIVAYNGLQILVTIKYTKTTD